MALSTSSISVGQTAVLLAQADADGMEIAIYNSHHSHSVEVGDATVTTSTGFPVAGGAALSFRLSPNEAVYAITQTGTHDVRVLML